MVNKVAYINRF